MVRKFDHNRKFRPLAWKWIQKIFWKMPKLPTSQYLTEYWKVPTLDSKFINLKWGSLKHCSTIVRPHFPKSLVHILLNISQFYKTCCKTMSVKHFFGTFYLKKCHYASHKNSAITDYATHREMVASTEGLCPVHVWCYSLQFLLLVYGSFYQFVKSSNFTFLLFII